MFKKASRRSGGTPLSGWQTQAATQPSTYLSDEAKQSLAKRRRNEDRRRKKAEGASDVWAYLYEIALAVSYGRPLPEPKIKKILSGVSEAGGIAEWARKQRNFKNMLAQIKRQRDIAARNANGAADHKADR